MPAASDNNSEIASRPSRLASGEPWDNGRCMSIDDLQAQLRGALDQQFAALKQQYEQAIADVRRQASTDAERDVAARLESARAEWDSALASILETTRAETRQQADEAARAQRRALELQLQQQLEQTVQHAVNSVRKSSELEIEALRRRVDQDVKAERQRGLAALEEERGRAEGERVRAEEERARLQQALEAERTRALAALEEERGRASAIEGERARLHADLEAERQRGLAIVEEERGRLAEAVDGERQRALKELETERARARTEVETVQQLLEAEIASAKAEAAVAQEATAEAEARATAAEAAAAAAESTATAAHAAAEAAAARAAAAAAAVPVAPPTSSVPASLARVPHALREVDAATSLSATLEALLHHAGAIAGRAALFLVNGDRLKSWKTIDIPEIDAQTVESPINGRDLLARAIQQGHATTASDTLPAPPFARLPADRPALAVPVMINGRAVAVIYADGGAADPPAGWTEGVDLVARHVSAVAALRAAMRTLDVLRGGAPDPALPGNGNGEESARRYARLLVSEIKLYNEGAVRVGRQQRDLRQRLRDEIDRALRLYEERVPPAVGARDQYFQQELVQTLADGDPTLLGH